MQFIVSTPNIRTLLETQSGIPLEAMVDLGLVMLESSNQLSEVVLDLLPFTLATTEAALISISELQAVYTSTNIYQLFPNKHGIIMSPWQLAKGVTVDEVIDFNMSLYGKPNPNIVTEQLTQDVKPKKVLTPMEQEIEDILNFKIPESSKDDGLPPVNKSNIIMHKNKPIDVSKLTQTELFHLAGEVEDYDAFRATEHIRTLYHSSVPKEKLAYPEPFLAGPSHIHNDLGFLHILQYQFWLWFFFIFLICFFFVSFLCTVRWCNTRTRPRRETRGVSRSKCGDLITATVPVTWAISIIVSETTDATDYYDGFGTSEIIVGVRAYQWGWEYYYPKTVDLQYNVKPSYSSFIGNSVKYNATASKTLHQNQFWRTYQNKAYDNVVTPAHLLTLPLDNTKVLNFLNFKDIGADSLQSSEAFKKVRTYSKTYTTNLNYVPLNTATRYALVNKLYLDNNVFTDSVSYGTETQHTLTSAHAAAANSATFLDANARTRFLNSVRGLNTSLYEGQLQSGNTDSLIKPANFDPSKAAPSTLSVLNNGTSLGSSQAFNNLASYPSLVNTINDDSDRKKFLYPHAKLLNKRFGTNYDFTNLDFTKKSGMNSDLNTGVASFASLKFDNTSRNNKTFDIESLNQGIDIEKQLPRTFTKLTAKGSNFNLSQDLNSLSSDNRFKEQFTLTSPSSNYYGRQGARWLDSARFGKTAGNRLFMEAPAFPIVSSVSHLPGRDYDSTSRVSQQVAIKAGEITHTSVKDETTSSRLSVIAGPRPDSAQAQTSSYWWLFWAHTNPDLRLTQNLTSVLNENDFYLPLFTDYADYDFLNDQAIELLEDVVWEASHPFEDYTAYLEASDHVLKGSPWNARAKFLDSPFAEEDLLRAPNLVAGQKPSKRYMPSTVSSTPMLATDDLIISKSNDHAMLRLIADYLDGNENLYEMSDSDYEHLMNLAVLKRSSGPNPVATPEVLNLFRSNFDSYSITPSTPAPVEGDFKSWNAPTERFDNPASLRATAKSLHNTYGAYQKVSKGRLDENRSNYRLESFAQLDFDQMLFSAQVPFKKLLGKNAESFFTSNFSNRAELPYFNFETYSKNALNFSFYDFPFALSFTNDMTRYLWFDWYVQWGKVEIQPASVNRFSSLGVPYAFRGYDYQSQSSGEFNKIETYFTRISRLRKNYLPTWTYTPFFANLRQVWTTDGNFYKNLRNVNSGTVSARKILNYTKWQYTQAAISFESQSVFTPSFSGDSTFVKSSWRPFTSAHSYYYANTHLADLLTKREYLYRQYFESNNKIIHLPYKLTASPRNPLVSELKHAFLFIDPLNFTTEYSRDFYYSSLRFFKFLLFKEWLIWLNDSVSNLPINPSALNNYLFFYFLGTEGDKSIGNNQELYKNQFRPMRKGINNMMRLQATGAIAMPTEIRLRILASSRDVIHSWAIPSAGIKIDCIPGYTSHRIMIFLHSGIYWGQCMEICGRFHHWMPIVVYFMKRDLFFLWCTHFAFRSHAASAWEISDRQYADYIRFASYDKNTWLTELSKSF